ncbi:MAG: tRNA (N(6)-L-threonylcarbamoyladenosine(37)-C(2))-methylthiotransferase MtaB, partial [Chloroflexota bacterium]|nr:tRNA (N(6)-L-threonylcarbamoyladenosine(37)-C(2))-methylthiotransferase MtaB [Chloroflexota bacterium]
RQLADAGYKLVAPDDEADIYILNTCTVTHIADRKCRNWLRQVRLRNPEALVAAIGCYSERARDELSRIDGVNLVLGNEQKSDLLKILSESGYGGSARSREESAASRTRAFIKVQDGCNNFCSYCIVPLVRGREKSVPADGVVGEVERRVADGGKEVVITGTEISSYHHDGVNLTGLLERILVETGVTRLRLSSLQPQEVTPEFISLWRDERLCRHFHLSLQSGSDSVLKRMKRRYSTVEYEQAVALIRKALPEAAITTDIIVGFPGETDEEFRESYEFCKRMEFARIHVFSYSPRPGTEAAQMRPRVPDKVKKQRSQQMLALAEESAADFRKRFAGKIMLVLWEQQTGGLWSGLTDNYIRVYK